MFRPTLCSPINHPSQELEAGQPLLHTRRVSGSARTSDERLERQALTLPERFASASNMRLCDVDHRLPSRARQHAVFVDDQQNLSESRLVKAGKCLP